MNKPITDDEITHVCEANAETISAIVPLYHVFRMKRRNTAPSMVCAGLCYPIIEGASRDKVVEWGARLADGVGLEASDPLYALREKLVAGIRDTTYNRAMAAVSWIGQAWNRGGKKTSALRTVHAADSSGRKLSKFAIPEVRR